MHHGRIAVVETPEGAPVPRSGGLHERRFRRGSFPPFRRHRPKLSQSKTKVKSRFQGQALSKTPRAASPHLAFLGERTGRRCQPLTRDGRGEFMTHETSRGPYAMGGLSTGLGL